MNTTTFIAACAVMVPVLAMWVQMMRWRREDRRQHELEVKAEQERREKAIEDRVAWQTGISTDIEGNTRLVLEAKKALEDHDAKCQKRWEKNWADHDEFHSDVARLKGKSE